MLGIEFMLKDAVLEVGSRVTGGDTVINPWCTLGGVATAICTSDEYIMYVECCY